FTRKPMPTYYACKDKTVCLDWELTPPSEYISKTFQVYIVQWMFFDNTNSVPTRMGTYIMNKGAEKPIIHTDGYASNKIIYNSSSLPQLQLGDLSEFKSCMYIRITVTFNITT
ncbi:unnamed protein product, partial [Candidula unifasciata]